MPRALNNEIHLDVLHDASLHAHQSSYLVHVDIIGLRDVANAYVNKLPSLRGTNNTLNIYHSMPSCGLSEFPKTPP